MAEEQMQEQVVNRKDPEVSDARSQHVEKILKEIKSARAMYNSGPFNMMREDMQLVRDGATKQWRKAGNYIANLTHRQVQQRTSALYARNPKAISRLKKRLYYQIWDENPTTLQQAMQLIQVMGQNPLAQLQMQQQLFQAQALIQDVQQGTQKKMMLKRLGKTLEILFEHYMDEQAASFKANVKQMVRRIQTNGVGFMKLGFQRAMQPRADMYAQLADSSEQLNFLKRLSADIADGEEDENEESLADELMLTARALQEQEHLIVREGPIFIFPKATRLIFSPRTTYMKTFENTDWLAEEYHFTKDQIQEIYEVDIGSKAKQYSKGGVEPDKSNHPLADSDPAKPECALHLVFEYYHKPSGLKYTVCDGYEDFLEEPLPPDVELERFYPYFVVSFNDVESEEDIYPLSDVRLMRHMQLEHNRAREGLRRHRRANQPQYATPKAAMSEEDKDKLRSAKEQEIIELAGLRQGQSVDALLQQIKKHAIDPNMYETGSYFEDILKTVGSQELDFGGVSKASATEVSVAQNERTTDKQSQVDEIDDFLTDFARALSQVFFRELSAETVKRIAGPGAVWPEFSEEEIVEEVYLDIQAGSSGRPNRAAEIANFERLAPTLIQIPGIPPHWLAEQAIMRLDDTMDISQAYVEGLPSIVAMNQVSKLAAQGQNSAGGVEPQDEAEVQRENNSAAAQNPRGGGTEGQFPSQVQ